MATDFCHGDVFVEIRNSAGKQLLRTFPADLHEQFSFYYDRHLHVQTDDVSKVSDWLGDYSFAEKVMPVSLFQLTSPRDVLAFARRHALVAFIGIYEDAAQMNIEGEDEDTAQDEDDFGAEVNIFEDNFIGTPTSVQSVILAPKKSKRNIQRKKLRISAGAPGDPNGGDSDPESDSGVPRVSPDKKKPTPPKLPRNSRQFRRKQSKKPRDAAPDAEFQSRNDPKFKAAQAAAKISDRDRRIIAQEEQIKDLNKALVLLQESVTKIATAGGIANNNSQSRTIETIFHTSFHHHSLNYCVFCC
uniref:Uncharacterized protein n=1 Tax=Aureoumbra lagunensis TaxID=44058 RepID=A0A7S3K204_9STRA|mmetsp:Transcript_2521/g.3385  ORF Transcript_2521/g.3385 Transcript_2521/m.3385 type:complete len:301 (+) Transcript_2521:159-1061(+)